jgi:phage terminase large subunit-like protein
VLDCGRRFGKDIIERNYASEGLLAGEPVAWYEPEYKSLMDNWNWMADTFFPITKDKSEQEKRLDLTTGGFIEMWSLQDKDASRGRHYKRVIINEAAKVPHMEYSWNAVIRITLADLQGGAMIGSTPKGLNYFWEMYKRGIDPLQADWVSFHKTTYDNPYIVRKEIEDIKASTPEIIFNQEILAEFVNMEGSVFRRIQEAATLEPITGPEEKLQYVAGVDVAASVDYTVISIMDVQKRHLVFIDRFNRVDYGVLEDRLHACYNRFHLESMTIESNSIGQGVIDHLQGRGMSIRSFTTTSATKDTIIKGLQSAFEHDEIKIINDPVLIGELLSFEAKRSPSGSFTYSAPAGMHDDCVMSLAIAWDAIAGDNWTIVGSKY